MRRLGAVLFLIALAVYLSNGRTIGAGDTLPAAYLPWSLLNERNFDLDEFPALHGEAARSIFPLLDGIPYYLNARHGHYVSAYAPGSGVLAAPVYALPVLLGVPADARWAERLEKLAAAIITALSVAVLFGALARVTTRGWALAIALVYAFGTSSLSMSSQGLWQHGPSQLFVALALYCLVRGLADERYLGYVGFPLAAAATMRSTDLFLVLPIAAWIAYAHRRRAPSLLAWALPPLVAVGAYHAWYFAGTDRGLGHTTAPMWAYFAQTPIAEGLPGVLVGATRGLFVYSPVLLFSLAGMVVVWRHGPAPWAALSVGPLLVVLLVSKWMTWWGGHSWGPRLLADLAPVLCFLIHPVVPYLDRRRLAKAAFAVLALWSIAAHGMGAWLYDRRWDAFAPDEAHRRLLAWRESPLAFYAREARAQLGWPWAAGAANASDASGLAAAYRAEPGPPVVSIGERFVLAVSATNTGPRAWRATAPGERGAVRLGWRWYRGEQEVAAGRERLLADVAPGESVRFDARVIAPREPGQYTLSVAMVSEFIGWFGEHGDRPVTMPVAVRPLDVAALLTEPLAGTGPAPAVTIATDRAAYRGQDAQALTVTLAYPSAVRRFDAYLILEPAGSAPLFFDGRTLPRPAASAWPPWVRGLPLPARASARFAIPVASVPRGTSRWHVVLTDPGGYRAVARSTAAFTVEP